MQDVAADRHGQPRDLALGAADGQRVEQRLRRMFMRAVAGIDHRAADLLRQQRRRAGRWVADDQDVGPHGVERHRRVDQRFALLHRGTGDRHVHDVGAEPLSGEFERRLRAGRGLVEQVDLGAAAQRRGLLLGLARDRDGRVGAVEQQFDVVRGKARGCQARWRWGKSGEGAAFDVISRRCYRLRRPLPQAVCALTCCVLHCGISAVARLCDDEYRWHCAY